LIKPQLSRGRVPSIRLPNRSRLFVFVEIFILALSSLSLTAATQNDSEIELTESTYRVGSNNTAEVAIHQRWRALTAQGRENISQIRFPYVPAFEEVEIKFIKTIKKDGSMIEGDPASSFDMAPSTEPLVPSFTDLKIRTIIPPNLETSDAVEYEVLLHIGKWPKDGDFWFVHDLSTSVRVLSEVVVLDLPADRNVALYESTAIPGKTEIVNGRRIERWVAANPEPAKATMERAAPLFAVSSVQSWEQFGEWLRSLNQDGATPTPEIAALA